MRVSGLVGTSGTPTLAGRHREGTLFVTLGAVGAAVVVVLVLALAGVFRGDDSKGDRGSPQAAVSTTMDALGSGDAKAKVDVTIETTSGKTVDVTYATRLRRPVVYAASAASAASAVLYVRRAVQDAIVG